MTARTKRDLVARGLALGIFLLVFAPWAELTTLSFFRVEEESGARCVGDAVSEVRAAGFALPIRVFDPKRAHAVEIEAVLALWGAYFSSAALVVLLPPRWVRGRFLAAAGLIAAFMTLAAVQGASGAVFLPGRAVDRSSFVSPLAYVPALAFLVLGILAAWRSRFVGVAGTGVAFGAFFWCALAAGWGEPFPAWGAVLSAIAASGVLGVSSANVSEP